MIKKILDIYIGLSLAAFIAALLYDRIGFFVIFLIMPLEWILFGNRSKRKFAQEPKRRKIWRTAFYCFLTPLMLGWEIGFLIDQNRSLLSLSTVGGALAGLMTGLTLAMIVLLFSDFQEQDSKYS